jgi:hypothetical protein
VTQYVGEVVRGFPLFAATFLLTAKLFRLKNSGIRGMVGDPRTRVVKEGRAGSESVTSP